MRHLSLWLTVLLLSGLPLTAAALDYGPNSSLLAAANAPQLSDSQGRTASPGEMSKPDIATADSGESEDAAPTPAPSHPRMTPGTQSPQPTSASHNPGSTASNKPRAAVGQQAPEPPTATWQSLLPGSIQ
jgi:hypothetical protein